MLELLCGPEGVRVPIYEYYCAVCQGRFSRLVRRIEDDVLPCCPRCGNREVEKLISAASFVRGVVHHRSALRQDATAVDREDPQAMAAFLKASGRLDDASGLYGSRAYRELIERRVDGATDADLADLVDDLAQAAAGAEATELGTAVALSKQVDNRLRAVGPPGRHDSEEAGTGADAGRAPFCVLPPQTGGKVEAIGADPKDEGPGGGAGACSRRKHSPRFSRDLGWG